MIQTLLVLILFSLCGIGFALVRIAKALEKPEPVIDLSTEDSQVKQMTQDIKEAKSRLPPGT